MAKQETFCGYPLDCSQILFAYVHLAPPRDVKGGEMYPLGRGGYGLAEGDIKKGERGNFMVGGNLVFQCERGTTFDEGERAAYDPKTQLLVKDGTPGAFPFFEVQMFVPSETGKRPSVFVFFDQPINE